MTHILDKPCATCGSSRWCGRKCAAGPAMDSYPPVTKRNESVTQAKQDVTNSNEDVTHENGGTERYLIARLEGIEARLVALEANSVSAPTDKPTSMTGAERQRKWRKQRQNVQ